VASIYQSWTGPTKVIQKILEEINQQLFNKIIWKNVISMRRIFTCAACQYDLDSVIVLMM
jgi:hypothetical protein